MTIRKCLIASAAILLLSAPLPRAVAQSPAPSWSQDDTTRIVGDVQKKLRNLTNYQVFDWLTFGIHGKTLVLSGYASRPTLKDDAERAVKGIPGIEAVENNIEVLSSSPNDDRIRASVYSRIYTSSVLRKYNANAGSSYRGPSVARMAGGITADPPIGFHAIHIIVNGGHVKLYGAVLNESDAAIANMQANSAPGTFSVDNNLDIEGSKPSGK